MRFHEEQRFGGTGFKIASAALLLPVPLILVGLLLAVPALREEPWALVLPLGIAYLIQIGLWLAMWRTRLVVDVEDDRVVVAARPFARRTIPAARIEAVRWMGAGVRRRFGIGIGTKYLPRRARYTVGNDGGVVLTLVDGWTIVIGSTRPAELGEAIRDVLFAHRPDLRGRPEEQQERRRAEA